MQGHTDQQFEDELKQLKNLILKMGGFVESMLDKSELGLLHKDITAAAEVIKKDKEVDQLEIDIDEMCVKLLALYQPAASDLRFITIGLKITNDLERMGDLASNIAKKAKKLHGSYKVKPDDTFLEMIADTRKMVKDALDSFVNRDVKLAEKVLVDDDKVDNAAWEIHSTLVKFMQENSEEVPFAIHLLFISRYMERLADHATNIAEEVIYLVKGTDIRHQGEI
jgi:phosphate transport system protein